jgi:hypothetical protein
VARQSICSSLLSVSVGWRAEYSEVNVEDLLHGLELEMVDSRKEKTKMTDMHDMSKDDKRRIQNRLSREVKNY